MTTMSKELEVRPLGHKILVACKSPEAKTASGIILPDEFRDRAKWSSTVGQVVELGPDAYGDVERFPGGPWCKVGDYVVFGKYEGTRLELKGDVDLRLLNDDQVVAVVNDPALLSAA